MSFSLAFGSVFTTHFLLQCCMLYLKAQYRFIYLAMIEWLECKFVSIPCEDFSAVYPLVQKETEGEPTVLAKQYEVERASITMSLFNRIKRKGYGLS